MASIGVDKLSRTLGYKPHDIIGPRWYNNMKTPRMAISNALRDRLGCSTWSLSKAMHRDHSTLLWYESEHVHAIANDSKYAEMFNKACAAADELAMEYEVSTNTTPIAQINIGHISDLIYKFMYGNEAGYRIRTFKHRSSLPCGSGEGDMGQLRECVQGKAVA